MLHWYSTSGQGASFTLSVAGAALYSSPLYADHPYKKHGNPFSPPVQVVANNLGIKVPSSGTSCVAFDFHNADMNLHLSVEC